MAEERKKEREERERKREEEERKKKSQLPKTNNLYALKQERIKRGLNPDGSEDHLLDGSAAKSKVTQSIPLLESISMNISTHAYRYPCN